MPSDSRSHSIRTISNAKIKTVKLTVVVVVGYLVCSAPFVFVQLYTVWGNPASKLRKSFYKLSHFDYLLASSNRSISLR